MITCKPLIKKSWSVCSCCVLYRRWYQVHSVCRRNDMWTEQFQDCGFLQRSDNAARPRILYHKRELHCSSCQLAKKTNIKDDAIPFLHSKAHTFKVDDAYTVDTPKDRSRQRFALPLGVSVFATIIYFGFIRDYGNKDKSVVGYLTKDIGDKLPDDVREKIYNEMNQSNGAAQTISDRIQSDK